MLLNFQLKLTELQHAVQERSEEASAPSGRVRQNLRKTGYFSLNGICSNMFIFFTI